MKYIDIWIINEDNRILNVDTVIVQNGTFGFHGKEYLGDESVVTTGNYPDEVFSAFVVLEQGYIYVTFHDTLPATVSGTYLNELMTLFDAQMERFEKRYNGPWADMEKGIITGEEAYNLRARTVAERLLLAENFIKNNIDNVVGRKLFKTRGVIFHWMKNRRIGNVEFHGSMFPGLIFAIFKGQVSRR